MLSSIYVECIKNRSLAKAARKSLQASEPYLEVYMLRRGTLQQTNSHSALNSIYLVRV